MSASDASFRFGETTRPAAPGGWSRARLAMTGAPADLGLLAFVGLVLMVCGGSLVRRRLGRRP